MFGNSDSVRLEPVKPEKLPEIKAYPFGCTAWTGTSDAEKTIVSRDPAIKIVERVTSSMRLEIDPALELPGQPREYWKITGGELTWSATVTGACTGGGSGKVAITDRGPGDEIATLRVWEDEKILRYSGGTGPWPGDVPDVHDPLSQPAADADGSLHGARLVDDRHAERHGRGQRHDDPRDPDDEPGRCHPVHHGPNLLRTPPGAVGAN